MSLEITKQEKYSTFLIKPNHVVWGLAVFISLIFIGCIFILIQATLQIITGDLNVVFVIFTGLLFWAAYHNFFNFYFLIFGKERIEIHDDFIKHAKIVWKITHSKKYAKSKIGRIEINDLSNTLEAIGGNLFGQSNVHVTFQYGRKKKVIGKQIQMNEVKLIIEELNHRKYTTQ